MQFPNRLAGQDKVDLLLTENEGDCTSEMGRGQFSIFGACEEKSGHGFHGFIRMKRRLKNTRLLRQMMVVLNAEEWCG